MGKDQAIGLLIFLTSSNTILRWTLLASLRKLPLLDHCNPSVHRLHRYNGYRRMDRLDNGLNPTTETNTGNRADRRENKRRNYTLAHN